MGDSQPPPFFKISTNNKNTITMKLQDCIIKPINKSDATVPGRYFDLKERQAVFLTTSYKIRKGEMLPGEHMWNKFLPYKMGDDGYRFQWDQSNPEHEGSILRTFLMRHTLVKVEGYDNPNLRSETFSLVDQLSVNEDLYDRIKEVNRMVNLVNTMSWDEQKDVCYSFGGNPIKLTKRELFLDLLHPATGRLMFQDLSATPIIDKCVDFLNKFGKDNMNEATRIETVCKKAILLGIIVRKASESSTIYLLDGETIANSEEGIIAYMQTNKTKYENQVRKVVEMKDLYAEPEDLDSQPELGSFEDAAKRLDKGKKPPEIRTGQIDPPKDGIWTAEQHEALVAQYEKKKKTPMRKEEKDLLLDKMADLITAAEESLEAQEIKFNISGYAKIPVA
jgi:hypothetical protein